MLSHLPASSHLQFGQKRKSLVTACLMIVVAASHVPAPGLLSSLTVIGKLSCLRQLSYVLPGTKQATFFYSKYIETH